MKRHLSTLLPLVSVTLLLGACGGGAQKPADEPDSTDRASDQGAADDPEGSTDTGTGDDSPTQPGGGGTAGLPTECANDDAEMCLPPKRFMLALCDGDYPSVGLWLFNNGSPWARGYLTGKTKAVYASTSGGSTGEMMSIDEEVLVLRKHSSGNTGGIVVSGASGAYDVMRWDGSCATVEDGLIRFDAIPRPKTARIIWSTLEVDIRDALKEDEVIRKAYIKLRKECKGVTMGDVSAKCEKADGALSKILAEHVRENGGVPTPKKIPKL